MRPQEKERTQTVEEAAEEAEARFGEESSPGIPAPRRPGEPATGDAVTATTEGGTTGGPGFGSVATPPGEGGILSDRRDERS